MLVRDILERNVRINRRKVGLVDGDRRFTYEEIDRRTNRLANGLRNMGLKKGDRLAIMANNCHSYVETYFAVAKTGAIIVPISPRLSSEEAAFIVRHSESTVLIYQEDSEETVQRMMRDAAGVKHLISIGRGGGNNIPFESLVAGSPGDTVEIPLLPDDLMLIMYTSGATGIPKGVMTSHANIMANTTTMIIELGIGFDEVNLLVMPLYHNGGLWPLMTHFYRGATTVLLSRFDVEAVLRLIESEGVTLLNLVPTMLVRLTTHPALGRYDLKSLRLIMYAGAPIAIEHLKKAMAMLGPHRFYTGLGSTESSGSMISFPTNEHALEGPLTSKLESVGRDSIGVEIRIVDEQGREQPSMKVGEITARGQNIAKGYWKIPEETAATFRKGWLYTGDMGYRDEDGYVFITDRKKDIIISGGENISSQEIEQAIYLHPAVQGVAAIGVPDEEWGEAVKAVIQLMPEYRDKVTGEEIIDFCKGKLAGYKRPKSIDFVNELPRNSVGKIMKQELRKKFRNVG